MAALSSILRQRFQATVRCCTISKISSISSDPGTIRTDLEKYESFCPSAGSSRQSVDRSYRFTMTTPHDHSTNPLHGITLERMLSALVERFGWATMGDEIRIRCFTHDPSIPSSLKFLRRTPWARAKVEQMYLDMVRERKD
jgi:hypothetical protein